MIKEFLEIIDKGYNELYHDIENKLDEENYRKTDHFWQAYSTREPDIYELLCTTYGAECDEIKDFAELDLPAGVNEEELCLELLFLFYLNLWDICNSFGEVVECLFGAKFDIRFS